jgi:hypothetical protein
MPRKQARLSASEDLPPGIYRVTAPLCNARNGASPSGYQPAGLANHDSTRACHHGFAKVYPCAPGAVPALPDLPAPPGGAQPSGDMPACDFWRAVRDYNPSLWRWWMLAVRA